MTPAPPRDEEGPDRALHPWRPDGEARGLTRAHALALAIVVLLLACAQAFTQHALSSIVDGGLPQRAIAGQLTTAEEIALAAVELRAAPDEAARARVRTGLSDLQGEVERFHRALGGAAQELGLGRARARGVREPAQSVHRTALGVVATSRSLLTRPPPEGPAADVLIGELLQVQREYARALGSLADGFEEDQRAQVARLRRVHIGLLLVQVGLVVVVGFMVLRPAVSGVRRALSSAREVEDRLRASEESKRAILAAIPDQLVRITRREAFLELKTGRPDPVPQGLSPRAWPLLAAVAGPYVDQALREGRAQEFSFQVPDGQGIRHLQVRLVVSGEDEVLAIVQDVTEKRFLEHRLLDAGTQERERVGRDLHDGLCQHLAGTGLVMQTLLSRLRRDQSISLDDLEMAARLVGEATAESRALARGLMPLAVERLGIDGALEQLAADLSRVHGVPIEADVDMGGFRTDDQVGLQLFRIAQEAATNAAKHAKANRIVLRLEVEPDGKHLLMEVIDDGIGLSPERRRPDSMGLRTMDYRARLVGAFLAIESAEGGGTRVSCRLSAASEDASERSGFFALSRPPQSAR